MSEKIYYKVVCIDKKDNSLKSWSYGNGRLSNFYPELPNFVITYKIGEWVYPKIDGSNLMVFNSFQAAVDFRQIPYGSSIFSCHIKNIYKIGIIFKLHKILQEPSQEFYALCKKRKQKKNISDHYQQICIPPEGTVFCGAVKLLERVA